MNPAHASASVRTSPTGAKSPARAAENERKADAARLLRTPDTPTDSDTAARARALLDAYPEDVFHVPSKDEWKRANEVLDAAGLSLTAISAAATA